MRPAGLILRSGIHGSCIGLAVALGLYVSAAFGPSVTGLEQLWYIATVVNGALASLLLRFGLVDCPADGEATLGCILLTSLFFIPLDGFVIGLLVDGGGRADLRAAGREQRRQLVCEAPFREHGAAAARRHRVHLLVVDEADRADPRRGRVGAEACEGVGCFGEAEIHDHELCLAGGGVEGGGVGGPLHLEAEAGRRLADLGDEDEVPHQVDNGRHPGEDSLPSPARRPPRPG